MQKSKLVVGYLMDDELSVKAANISKSLNWLTKLKIEDLVEFFEGLLALITQIADGEEESESLQVFLTLWREVALEASEIEDEDSESFWETLANSIQRAMDPSRHSILVSFDEEDDDELDSPWIDIIDEQPRQKGIMHHTTTHYSPFAEPVVVEVTEQERDHYLAQPLSELGLSTRAYNCLIRENITTLRELVAKADWDLLEYDGFGNGSLHQVKDRLAAKGLFLGMDLDNADDAED